jgi:hypothetical protein
LDLGFEEVKTVGSSKENLNEPKSWTVLEKLRSRLVGTAFQK